ncbi:MAG TPA: hypothetical protein VN718_02080 [Rhizomicrobium sp.]|nr:hypothetical protein [Rhizomicrobium sp.]
MKRRGMLAGIVAVLAAGAVVGAGGAAWKFHLFGRYYPPTPYDDLLKQIADREPAAVFGHAALAAMPGANAASLARALRGRATLSELAPRDPKESRVTEVSGWVVPESVARYAALAAAV